MINMFKADLYRSIKSKGMFFLILAVIATFLASIFLHEPGGIRIAGAFREDAKLKFDIQQIALNFSYFYFFIIPVYVLISSEFGEKTIKNTITSAISKRKYYISKYLFTVMLCDVVFVLGNLMFYVVNMLVNDGKYVSDFGFFFGKLMLQLPIITAVVSLFVCLAFVIKKGAVFNALTIVFPILYMSIAAFIVGSAKNEKVRDFVFDYFLKYEVSKMLNDVVIWKNAAYRNECWLICAIAIAVTFVLGYLSFTKREID